MENFYRQIIDEGLALRFEILRTIPSGQTGKPSVILQGKVSRRLGSYRILNGHCKKGNGIVGSAACSSILFNSKPIALTSGLVGISFTL
jgi:hypothetical protein